MTVDPWSRRLADLASREAGLDLSRCRAANARKVLESVAQALRMDGAEAVLAAARGPGATPVVERILSALLVHETFFHRYTRQLDVLEQQILPSLLSTNPRKVRLWSAGCSSGPEAYSLAMIALRARDALGVRTEVEVIGTDVSPHAVDVAARGVYPATTVAELPRALVHRFLEKEGERYRVGPELVATVRFRKHNLRNPPVAGRFHVICCRNVLMYLQDEVAGVAVAHLSSALEPNGVLAIGHGESLRRFASLVTPDPDTSINLYRPAARAVPREVVRPGEVRRRPQRTASAAETRSTTSTGTGTEAKRTVLRGVYDARRAPEKLEALRTTLAAVVNSDNVLEIDADPAESLDGATGLMIGRAARAAGGRIVVRATRASVRAWAQRHGLTLR